MTFRRTEAESRVCSQKDCPGDGRYQPPGRGHLLGCQHNPVTWCWEEVPPNEERIKDRARLLEATGPDEYPTGYFQWLAEEEAREYMEENK